MGSVPSSTRATSTQMKTLSFHAEGWHVCEAPNLQPDGVSSCHLLCLQTGDATEVWAEQWWPRDACCSPLAAHYNLRTAARIKLPLAEPGPAVASGPLLLVPSPNPAKPKQNRKLLCREEKRGTKSTTDGAD